MMGWISLATLTHLPGHRRPRGSHRTGLPVGIQIVGPYLEDRHDAGGGSLPRGAAGRIRPAARRVMLIFGFDPGVERYRAKSVKVGIALAVTAAAVALAPPASAAMPSRHYSLNIEGRRDFHTWIWAGCVVRAQLRSG